MLNSVHPQIKTPVQAQVFSEPVTLSAQEDLLALPKISTDTFAPQFAGIYAERPPEASKSEHDVFRLLDIADSYYQKIFPYQGILSQREDELALHQLLKEKFEPRLIEMIENNLGKDDFNMNDDRLYRDTERSMLVEAAKMGMDNVVKLLLNHMDQPAIESKLHTLRFVSARGHGDVVKSLTEAVSPEALHQNRVPDYGYKDIAYPPLTGALCMALKYKPELAESLLAMMTPEEVAASSVPSDKPEDSVGNTVMATSTPLAYAARYQPQLVPTILDKMAQDDINQAIGALSKSLALFVDEGTLARPENLKERLVAATQIIEKMDSQTLRDYAQEWQDRYEKNGKEKLFLDDIAIYSDVSVVKAFQKKCPELKTSKNPKLLRFQDKAKNAGVFVAAIPILPLLYVASWANNHQPTRGEIKASKQQHEADLVKVAEKLNSF